MGKTTIIDSQKLLELELLASIPKSAHNSMLILDSKGKIQWANKGFEDLYGYTYSEFKAFHDEENSEFINVLNDVDKSFFQTNPSLSFSRSFLTKDYTKKWIQSTLTPVKNSEGKIERFIVIETDISKQKEVEEELVQRWENTQTLTEHLESVKSYIEEQIKDLSEQKKALQIAKEKSEEVLNKVLPYEVAIQLKKKGYAAPRHYKKVTILNLNIRNFIELSEIIPIEDLVTQLHNCFTLFDSILENHYVEKIKTTGGTYLGAGGVPLRNRSNPIDVVLSSLKMGQVLNETNAQRKKQGLLPFNTGIGIHTGKVIAGVVGKNKLSYDIWGDTVNVASTIENNIPDETIHISESTYHQISDYFECSEAEKIILGNAEEILLYKVERIMPAYSEDEKGIFPNEEFMNILSKL